MSTKHAASVSLLIFAQPGQRAVPCYAVQVLNARPSLCAVPCYAVQVLNAQEEAHAMHFKKMREQFAPCRLPNNPHRLVKTTSTC
jgi:hypothetical protein